MQNFKIFLTAFVTGLVIFGILAVLLIHFGFRTMSGEQEFDFGTGDTAVSDTYGENAVSQDQADNGKSPDDTAASDYETDITQAAD